MAILIFRYKYPEKNSVLKFQLKGKGNAILPKHKKYNFQVIKIDFGALHFWQPANILQKTERKREQMKWS